MFAEILFGIGLGIALNQIRVLQKRISEVEDLLLQVVEHLDRQQE